MLLAGLAKPLTAYALLITARALGGCGEAGFVTIGGPFIQDAAGAKQGLWLGVFYAAIPAGTALGYGYGAFVAQRWTWAAAFYVEAIAMVPLALLFLLSKDDGSRVVAPKGDVIEESNALSVDSGSEAERRPPSLKEELGDEWLSPHLFRFGASSLLGDIERQLEHHVTGAYSASYRHPMG